jgi:hypothetical protein
MASAPSTTAKAIVAVNRSEFIVISPPLGRTFARTGDLRNSLPTA